MSISTAAPEQQQPAPASSKANTWANRVRRGQKLDDLLHRFDPSLPVPPSLSPTSTSSSAASSSSSSSPPVSPQEPSAAAAGSSSSLSAIEGPFQLQEYLSILISRDPHDVERIVALPHESDLDPSQPGTSIKGKERSCSDASGSISMDEDNVVQSVDTDIWVYEQLRRVVLDLSTPWLTSLQEDCDKNAKPDTCSAMNAGDWMYLCASHGEEKQCCAIDYTIHTLDGTTSLLNSARHFPSRTYVPNTSLRHFGSMARRLSRIFVHAWCYHRDVFQACEAETSLYTRFFALLERYDLLATDNLPPPPPPPQLLPPPTEGSGFERGSRRIGSPPGVDLADDLAPSSSVKLGGGGTTNRIRSYSNRANASARGRSKGQFGTTMFSTRDGKDHLKALARRVDELQLGEQRTDPLDDRDDLGLVPPPAPSPRPTSILQRDDLHDDDDEDHWGHEAPPCTAAPDAESRLDRSGSDVGTRTIAWKGTEATEPAEATGLVREEVVILRMGDRGVETESRKGAGMEQVEEQGQEEKEEEEEEEEERKKVSVNAPTKAATSGKTKEKKAAIPAPAPANGSHRTEGEESPPIKSATNGVEAGDAQMRKEVAAGN